jgi:CubicO group peptidase (beta-lactamase class C family)
LWQHASGVGHKEGESVTADSVFWLASQSKLMCTVASLITVEKGLIGLDDDVAEILPDLAALEVLDGGEDADGIPTTKPRQNKITLR